jgi:hypothetical protein
MKDINYGPMPPTMEEDMRMPEVKVNPMYDSKGNLLFEPPLPNLQPGDALYRHSRRLSDPNIRPGKSFFTFGALANAIAKWKPQRAEEARAKDAERNKLPNKKWLSAEINTSNEKYEQEKKTGRKK